MRFCEMTTANKGIIKCGNHTKTPATPEQPNEIRHNFTYYWTVICQTVIRDGQKLFWANVNGYGSVSTKHAVSMYRNYLNHMGYKEIPPPAWVRA